MATITLILLSVPLLALAATAVEAWRHRSDMLRLREVKPPLPGASAPAYDVGIVVPAKDEEKRVQLGLRSLLRSTGLSHLRVVAVDDRSADATGNLMDEVAAARGDLIPTGARTEVTIIHNKELPPGWLGKPHACWLGAGKLTGGDGAAPQFLLFTDADVIFHERAVAEAARLMEARGLDFLTVFPEPEATGPAEGAFLQVFIVLMAIFSRPWAVGVAGGQNHLGIGAFLMVRTDRYLALGGHELLRSEVVDDIKLSLLFRAAGFRSAVVSGQDRVRVRWQEGFMATWRGIRKNAFAAHDYSLGRTMILLATAPLLFIAPWLGLVLGPSAAIRAVSAATLLLLLLMHRAAAREVRLDPWSGFLMGPAMALAFVAGVAASVVSTIAAGGVLWRDTFYPLRDLRRARMGWGKAVKLTQVRLQSKA